MQYTERDPMFWRDVIPMQVRSALVFAAMSMLAAVVVACGGEDNGPTFANVLEELQPGTTLHTVDVRYRRYGPAAEIYAQHFPDYGPETLRRETWMEFDEDGNPVSIRGESRLEDGTIHTVTRTDGTDVVVEDRNGVEQSRYSIMMNELTVETYRDSYARAIDETVAALDEHPDAPTVTLRNTQMRVIEERREFTRTLHPASASSYSAPYLYDLKPVEEIRRSYVVLDGSAGYRSEIAVVGDDGTETVIEYTDRLVVEILSP